MEVFRGINGKYGVTSKNRVVVAPIYDSLREMVAKDPFFTNQTQQTNNSNNQNETTKNNPQEK